MERIVKKVEFQVPTQAKATRVAAYARVSSGKDAMLHSLSAQVSHYSNFIQNHSGWLYCGVYADEALTGTKDNRAEFLRLMEDCKAGKIDMIITKSISRFARNTVTLLQTVRELKALGVDVYFEKENIYTLDSKGELLITIMSSLAQEESRSISENVTWGQRKRFSDGKVSLPYKQFLGYEKGEDGFPKIVPEQAETVRLIYKLFMSGKTPTTIAKILTSQGIPTPAGKHKWGSGTIMSILTNEKYKGSALLQKCFTVDFLTKKQKVNEGEVPQYFVEHSHEAIIDPAEWEAVQHEIERRRNLKTQYSGNSVFSNRLVCADCGTFLGPKVWHSTSKYKRTVWQCSNKFKNDKKCQTPHLYETDIRNRFVVAFSRLTSNKDALLEDCRIIVLTDCAEIDKQMERLLEEIEVVTELTRKCITENSTTAQSQEEYERKYNGFVERY